MGSVQFLLVKDPEQVRGLGTAKERENMEFRADLKGGLCPEEELDERFHRLYSEVCAQTDCTQCARCCLEMPPLVSKAEGRWMARKLGITVEELQARHMEKVEDSKALQVKAPCPMLEGERCSMYEQRPDECRSYPHLHKRDMRSRLFGVVANAETCPIVFNVYERLKHELGWRSRSGPGS